MITLNSLRDRYRVAANPLFTERRVELVLLLLALLLILQLVYGAFRLAIMGSPEAVLPAADSLQVKTALIPASIEVEQSNEIRNRPLFWASRLPVAAVAVVSEPDAVKKSDFKGVKLLGVFGAGDSAGIIALVKGKQRRLRVGDEVGGWKLESVGLNEAVFAAGEQQERLTLLPEHLK